jgi:hypothetical protein
MAPVALREAGWRADETPSMEPNRGPGTAAASPSLLIGGAIDVDLTAPMAGCGGGLAAFQARDRLKSGPSALMALQMRPEAPARGRVIDLLSGTQIPGLLLPVAHGPAPGPDGKVAWFVVVQAPPGPSIWPESAISEFLVNPDHPDGRPTAAIIAPWSEADLLELVLRPAAMVLQALLELRLTHRAIRPTNLFRGGRRMPITLGAAWAAPPASLQPAIFEAPYVAMCAAHARGDGSIADDVYALGVTLLTLALGYLPLQGLSDDDVIRRKLELGSFAALVGEARLAPGLVDLLRGMLAEDPDHRPAPALLADPAAARARRVAARPLRRAQRSLELGVAPVWNARMLAHAVARAPERAVRFLGNGEIERWLRRGLGDATLAVRMEELVAVHAAERPNGDRQADASLALRCIAILDPLAPLCWGRLVLWPEGLGTGLAAALASPAGPSRSRELDDFESLVTAEIATRWAAMRPERCSVAALRADAVLHRTLLKARGWSGGLPRLAYCLVPLLACRSPLLGGVLVMQPTDLPAALDAAAARADIRRQTPLDREITAFLAARGDAGLAGELAALADADPIAASLIQLNVLASLQDRAGGISHPGLAGLLAEQVAPAVAGWHNKRRRQAVVTRLAEASRGGVLSAMRALFTDAPARDADQRGHAAALAAVRAIDRKLSAIDADAKARGDMARRICREVIAAGGALAVTASTVAALLS